MRSETYTTLKMMLGADDTVPDEHRQAILEACRNGQGIDKKPSKMIGAKEAAGILNCCIKTIHRYSNRGFFQAVRYSCRRVRFRLSEIQAFAEGGRQIER